jgi:MATE family multidrug resistance protein
MEQNPYDSPRLASSEIPAPSPEVDHATWWSRPCGGREVLAIALPLVVSTMFWSIQWFVDRMFLMWHSTKELPEMTASLPAGMAHWTMICFPMGIAAFVNTFVAQYHGAGKPERIGLAVAQGVRLGWITTPLFLLAFPLAPYLFFSSENTRVAALEAEYFQYLALGGGAIVISNALSAFYTGRGMTRIVMLVQVGGTLVNIVLDYLLIFGRSEVGIPELGIKGAAIATAASNWFNVAAFTLLLRWDADREKFGLVSGNRFDAQLFWRLLRFGAPGGLPMLVEALSFTLLTHFITEISDAAGAATGLAFNVNSIAFIPIFGFSIATSTLVGQKLGENQPELAARATWTSLVISIAYTSLWGIAYLAVPDLFLLAHGAFANQREFGAIHDLTVVLLRFVTAYCIFDAAQLIFVGALKGAGDTFFILIATTTISVVYVTLGRLGQQYGHWGLYGWWWVLTAWLCTLAIVYLARFLQGKWKAMRVIEHEALP